MQVYILLCYPLDERQIDLNLTWIRSHSHFTMNDWLVTLTDWLSQSVWLIQPRSQIEWVLWLWVWLTKSVVIRSVSLSMFTNNNSVTESVRVRLRSGQCVNLTISGVRLSITGIHVLTTHKSYHRWRLMTRLGQVSDSLNDHHATMSEWLSDEWSWYHGPRHVFIMNDNAISHAVAVGHVFVFCNA